MTPQQFVAKPWNYCHVLRDDGLSCGDYVGQLTDLPAPDVIAAEIVEALRAAFEALAAGAR